MDEKLKDARFNKWVIVQAYKHDGSLHRQWSPAYLTEETDEYWALSSRASLVVESDGRRWMTKEHAVFILYKHRWMNIICMNKEDGGISFYVNIASPTVLDKGYLKYIDYDLDVKLFPDGMMKELDLQEYERHADIYGYSSELNDAVKSAMHRVIDSMKNRRPPFDGEDVRRIYEKFLEETRPFSVMEKN